jgi:hypothetical protein
MLPMAGDEVGEIGNARDRAFVVSVMAGLR